MADNIALLQHQISKFGVVTIMDVTMYDILTNEPVLELDTLKVSNINTDGSTKEIRGGMTADLLLAYNHSRTVNIEMTDALLSLYSLQKLWGSELNTGSVRFHEKIDVTLGSTKKIIIGPEAVESASGDIVITDKNLIDTKEPGTYLHIFDKTNNHKLTSEEYTAAWEGKILTIDLTNYSEHAVQNDQFTIYGASLAETVDGFTPVETVLKSTSFPERVKLVGKTVFLDEKSGKEILAEIEIPKFQFGNTFNMQMDAEGEAATFDFSGVGLADSNTKELIKIKTIKRGVHMLG